MSQRAFGSPHTIQPPSSLMFDGAVGKQSEKLGTFKPSVASPKTEIPSWLGISRPSWRPWQPAETCQRPKMDDTSPKSEETKLKMDFLLVTSVGSGPQEQNNVDRFRSHAGNDSGVRGEGRGSGSWLLLKKLIGGGVE